jgi:hypothetical protein
MKEIFKNISYQTLDKVLKEPDFLLSKDGETVKRKLFDHYFALNEEHMTIELICIARKIRDELITEKIQKLHGEIKELANLRSEEMPLLSKKKEIDTIIDLSTENVLKTSWIINQLLKIHGVPLKLAIDTKGNVVRTYNSPRIHVEYPSYEITKRDEDTVLIASTMLNETNDYLIKKNRTDTVEASEKKLDDLTKSIDELVSKSETDLPCFLRLAKQGLIAINQVPSFARNLYVILEEESNHKELAKELINLFNQ